MSHEHIETVNPTLSKKQLKMLCNIAIEAAQEAGQWIEKYDRHNLTQSFKDAGSSKASQLVTDVDIASEGIIRQRLKKIPEQFNTEQLYTQQLNKDSLDTKLLDIAFVGEESSLNSSCDVRERFEKPYFWCVDPLDGTLPFTEGRSGYAVSIALVDQSGEAIIGVVYDPTNQVLLHAIKGQGCYRNLSPFSQTTRKPKSLIVYADASFKTHTKYELAVDTLNQCAEKLDLDGITFVYGNGAVKNACHVLDSSSACYLKLPKKEEGGGSIWDYAATLCIANEASAWASNSHGQPLALNPEGSTFMNQGGVLFASNKQIANSIINTLKQKTN